MDYEKIWYELKQWLILNNEREMLIQMTNLEIVEMFTKKEVKTHG